MGNCENFVVKTERERERERERRERERELKQHSTL